MIRHNADREAIEQVAETLKETHLPFFLVVGAPYDNKILLFENQMTAHNRSELMRVIGEWKKDKENEC